MSEFPQVPGKMINQIRDARTDMAIARAKSECAAAAISPRGN